MMVTNAMLGNATIAAVLALLALAVGCVCRSPAVRHLAWLLVLLKLITPPLLPVPLHVLPATKDELGITHDENDTASIRPFSLILRPLDSSFLLHPSSLRSVLPSSSLLTAVWIFGATGWFVWQGRRIVRFRRRLVRADDAGPEVVVSAHRLAASLGIACPPAIKAVTGIGSPMLWGWGRGAVVLFPRELLARLAPEARDTLLAHELAHFLRRDHWVRVLEFIATGLYWWHPAVWVARAGIEAAEEECCDTWVVGGLAASPRRYAEALLATVDFDAELRRPCLPPGACAANRASRLLHRRLVGIIRADGPSQLRLTVAVQVAIVAVLLAQPVLLPAAPAVTESLPDLVVKDVRPPSITVSLPNSTQPPAWAAAVSSPSALMVLARDREVVLRRPDGTVKELGPGKPIAVAFAPGGERLATAGPGTLVRTWDEHGCLLAKTCVSAAARSVAFTPDGTHLLVLDAEGQIWVRDPNTLAPLSVWSLERSANSIACSPDCQTVAVSFGSWLDVETGWVECWSIRERRKLVTFRASAPVGASRFSPDGGMLVIGGWNGRLAWRALPCGELVGERQLPKEQVAAAAFSPDAGTLPLMPPPDPLMQPMPEPPSIRELSQRGTQVLKR